MVTIAPGNFSDSVLPPTPSARASAVLDDADLGDIHGAWGIIRQHDTAARKTWLARLLTLLVIAGPGLVTMVADNDAGGIATYAQAGQNYGTSLLWTLLILIPVLIVNQEMVVRLGAVTGVGHARLIFERFGKFWGAFSVGDLFLLNFLTIVTEFIGFAQATLPKPVWSLQRRVEMLTLHGYLVVAVTLMVVKVVQLALGH